MAPRILCTDPSKILYTSTNHRAKPVTFREALMQGQASDKGLFMPDRIPLLTADEISFMMGAPYSEVAFTVMRKFLDGDVPKKELKRMTREAYDFEVPLEEVKERRYVMRLDQGPTASFKDFAAQMMARLMDYYLRIEGKRLHILTATSGDTGGAVAHAFYGMENIRVTVLFPEKGVSDRQRKQMTTLGDNITTIAVDGTFDDCQALAKDAFADSDLSNLNLSSANSINFGRLLPQAVYYFYSYANLCRTPTEEVVFAVPSGNFGNLMGGVIAREMGLPVSKFIIATNENDEFPRFMERGTYEPISPSRSCLSNAMNVGHPSNLARLVHLYNGHMDEKGKIMRMPNISRMRKDFETISVSDVQTKRVIHYVFTKYDVLLEPHGAVAWLAVKTFKPEGLCISLETAHPAKFPEVIREALGVEPELPESMKDLDEKKEEFEKLPNDYVKFKQFLQDDSS